MQDLLSLNDIINYKIAEVFFKQKIFLVNFYYDPESGSPSIIDSSDSLHMKNGIKPARLIDHYTYLDHLSYNEYMRYSTFCYDGYHPYSLEIVPDYVRDDIALNIAIQQIINTEELKENFTSKLKLILDSNNEFDLLMSTNFQKCLAIYEVLNNI